MTQPTTDAPPLPARLVGWAEDGWHDYDPATGHRASVSCPCQPVRHGSLHGQPLWVHTGHVAGGDCCPE